MSDFTTALQEKINDLESQKDALGEQLANVDAKIEVLRQLLEEEGGKLAVPKRRGRPPGTKKPVPETDPLLLEAAQMEGTDPEVAARLRNRKFQPTARVGRSLGAGITAGAGKGKPKDEAATGADKTISIDDNVVEQEV